ncbi:hypothetical protein H2198_003591 [Neophaeococcomyces mojaviensis]|uniref:Uncharacterized protein n=1 Tax=Neophaeococcomyces mojaviensis TaxID=3383035 RepID=A0ACC3AB88_9EURO|nr:hypothetical protein H2198_003591 [Knufia sp. JES_112]
MTEAEIIPSKNAEIATTSALGEDEQPATSQPQEQLEIREPSTEEDETKYPTGSKLWLNLASIMMCSFLRGLDLTIVAVTVPSLTNEFKTVADIGWYNAAYGLVGSACVFFFGKVYSVFDIKRTYMMSIVVFWLGSVVCTFAKTSKMFICGRALAGLGAAWQSGGTMTQFNTSFPLHKRPFWVGMINFVQSCAMVAAPIVGGGLIQRFSWRACFGINIPLNAVALAFTAYAMQNPDLGPEFKLPFREKVKRLDAVGTLICVPALTCLFIALQWGGTRYGWSDARIVALLVLAGVLLGGFGYLQYRLQERATLPPRIIRQRSVLAGAWFTACFDGSLAVTEAYLMIYFQGVRGLSPAKSGLLSVPMIVGLAVSSLVGGIGMTKLGYYAPFMIATTVLAPIASGLLTTLNLDSQLAKAAALLGMLGFSLGLSMGAPFIAISTILKTKDVAIGGSILGFGGGMGSALFVSTAAVLFQNRLEAEVGMAVPGMNITNIEHAGLSDIRGAIGEDKLKSVLVGYNTATVQTLYIPLALTILMILGSGLIEWRSTKKKQT